MTPTQRRPMTLAFGGDVMLGRDVTAAMERHGRDWPLAPIAPLLHAADLAVINLECALGTHHRKRVGSPKECRFGAPRHAADALAAAGIGCVNLANNHALDFDAEGLRDTLAQLDRAGIDHFGAGLDVDAAECPVVIERNGVRLGFAGFCDHQADFAAGPRRAGIAFLDCDHERAAAVRPAGAIVPLVEAGVEWPILSMHWGPNFAERPSSHYRRIAHAAVEAGWRIVHGHSSHIVQGIELHRDGAIAYGAGNLFDDYYVEPDSRNDHALLYRLVLDARRIERVELEPPVIAQCRVQPAGHGVHADHGLIASRIARGCAGLATTVHRDGSRISIDGPSTLVQGAP